VWPGLSGHPHTWTWLCVRPDTQLRSLSNPRIKFKQIRISGRIAFIRPLFISGQGPHDSNTTQCTSRPLCARKETGTSRPHLPSLGLDHRLRLRQPTATDHPNSQQHTFLAPLSLRPTHGRCPWQNTNTPSSMGSHRTPLRIRGTLPTQPTPKISP